MSILGRIGRGTGSASVVAPRDRRKRAWQALVLLLCLGACTDLRVAHQAHEPAAQIGAAQGFRFLRAPLAADARASEAARSLDGAVRTAIAGALQAHGYRPAPPEASRALGIDYTLRDAGGVNAKRLDSPSDYSRSWRSGGSDDGTGAMDHTIADTAFYRELTLTVLLFAPGAGALAWEGTARQSFPGELPQGARLQGALDRMVREVLAPLPRAGRGAAAANE